MWSSEDLATFKHELASYQPGEQLTSARLMQEMLAAVTAAYPDDQWTKYSDPNPDTKQSGMTAGTPFVQVHTTRVKLAAKKSTLDKVLDIFRPIRKEMIGDVGTGVDAGGFTAPDTSPGVAGGALGLDVLASLLLIGPNAVEKQRLKSAMKEIGEENGNVAVAQFIDKVLGTVRVELRVGVLGPEHLGDLLALGDMSYLIALEGVANADRRQAGVIRIRNNTATVLPGETFTDNDLMEYANWQALLYNNGINRMANL